MANMGKMVHDALQQSTLDTLQTRLNENGAIEVKPNLVLLEQRGQKAYGIWSCHWECQSAIVAAKK